MSRNKNTLKQSSTSVALRLQTVTQPELHAYVSSLHERYGKYRLPLSEGRKVIDEAMGSVALTSLLYDARNETE